MSTNERSPLSREARLIVASNLAVAQAIREMTSSQLGGTPAVPIDKQVVRSIKNALRMVDELEADSGV